MADRVSQSVFGDDWLRTYSQFRVNPASFLDKKKITKEAFCLDILKEIYLDRTDTRCKICLLSALQDITSQFITDVNLFEQIVGSLTNLYTFLGDKQDKKLLKCQVLVTVTTILLTSKIINYEDSPLFLNFKIFILSIVLSSTEDPAIISTACKCLEEIEIFFPGILESDFERLLNALKKHFSPAFQSYVTLLSICIRHMIEKSAKNQDPTARKNFLRRKHHEEENYLLILVAYIQELLPLMSHIAFYKVLKDLIHVVKDFEELRPSIFKLFLPTLIMTADVPLLHLAFDLMEEFDDQLFSLYEKQVLLRQLINAATHPCLTSHHRLLFSNWLNQLLLKNKKAFAPVNFSYLLWPPGIITIISMKNYRYFLLLDIFIRTFYCNDVLSAISPQLHLLLPGPFDGLLTQEKKSCMFSICIPKHMNTSAATDFLIESASGLKKCALLLGGTKAAASFFRTLYTYFVHHKTPCMNDFLYKLFISIMKTSPHLSPYALSFLNCAKRDSDSNFTRNVLSHLVEHVLSISMKQFTEKLEYYLEILESASQESGSVCKPRSVLKLLQKVLNDSNLCKNNPWCLGNNILSVCRSFLENYDVQAFYYDLAEVLCLVTKTFDDVDVKDRAKIYYSMITALSKTKIQSIFKLQTNENDSKNPLTSFVPGGNSNLQFASLVQDLPEPVFLLARIERLFENTSIDINDSSAISTNQDILKMYQTHIQANESVVKLPFSLKLVEDADKKFFGLFGIIISTESSPSCKEISVIEVPVFKALPVESNVLTVDLDLIPVQPSPLTLNFKAEFTCENGQSYSCQLPSIALNFEDLILPLPVPESFQNISCWKQNLFDALWKDFDKEILEKGAEAKCCKSAFCLPMEKTDLQHFVEEKWAPFIMAKFPNCSYNVAMHFSPNFHLLMKISTINEKPFINIIVDDTSMLPWTSLFLQEVRKNVTFTQ
ncbi:AP-5 complex subunit beta-1-like [Uloborus diversus]|uniref:AP-5 complex subunit beta-1-like n=1 Tax=Uloborus diversus TaxID=327109 RepID=UPI0024099109|nr:AP-5 complex subunit beta-1-like [Uloborus diversus]